jgi:hypothetical protein
MERQSPVQRYHIKTNSRNTYEEGGEMVKTKRWLVILAVIGLLIPNIAGASLVFETTGWIMEPSGINFEFVADTTPQNYQVTLSDLSETPMFGFDFLYLSITTATENVGSLVGPGSFFYPIEPGESYFANVLGTGGGDFGAGLFGIEIKAVPIPPSVLLLAPGLLGLLALRRRQK